MIAELKNMPGVYAIRCRQIGKQYIGSSKNLSNRIESHFNLLRSGKHYIKEMQSDYDKFGRLSFDYAIMEFCDEDILTERECQYVNQIKNTSGLLYNMRVFPLRKKVAIGNHSEWRNFIKQQGYKISALENRADMPAGTLQKFMNGKREIPKKHLERFMIILQAYGFVQ